MTKIQLINSIKYVGSVVTGAIISHFSGSYLNAAEIQKNQQSQAIIDHKTDQILKSVQNIESSLNTSADTANTLEDSIIISKEVSEKMDKNLNDLVSIGEQAQQLINSSKDIETVGEYIAKMLTSADELQKVLNDWVKNNGNNKFLPDINIQQFYDYLDSLTMVQELALLHMLFFIVLLCCVFTVLSIFFGNEIIKYFNLETKFTFLSSFFKLRAKLQRYYLLWNVFMMFVICFIGIYINLLLFGSHY